jgi:hypothetical protein
MAVTVAEVHRFSVRKGVRSVAGEIVVVVAVVTLPVLIPLATFVRSSSLAKCVRVPASAARYVTTVVCVLCGGDTGCKPRNADLSSWR